MKVSRNLRLQSGVIPYRVTDDGIEILLVRSSNGKEWTVPKGGVEEDMTRKTSAAKEALEEGGVSGEVGKRVGSFVYNKNGMTQLVDIYPMEVTKVHNTYLEVHTRKRKWFASEKAMDKLQNSSKSQLAIHLRKMLNNLRDE